MGKLRPRETKQLVRGHLAGKCQSQGFTCFRIIREPKLLTTRLSLKHPNSTAQGPDFMSRFSQILGGRCALLIRLVVTYPQFLSNSSPACSLPRQADCREMHHSGSLVLMQPAARRLLREAGAPRGPLAMALTPAACGSSCCPVPLILGSPGSCSPPVTPFPSTLRSEVINIKRYHHPFVSSPFPGPLTLPTPLQIILNSFPSNPLPMVSCWNPDRYGYFRKDDKCT